MSGPNLEGRLDRASRKLGDGRTGAGADTAIEFEHDDNIVRFATNGLGLDLFPSQATLLKVIACAEDLFTQFDDDVIAEWMDGYRPVHGAEGSYFEGNRGTTPDLLERIRHCAATGRSVFREVTLVAGRRSSKTFIAAIVTTWQVSMLLGLRDPQAVLGLPDGKQITLVAMSTNKDSTSRDVYGDLVGMVRAAPVFERYVERIGADSIRFWTPAQIESGAAERGERGLIVISALPTTASAGRGPAVYGTLLDEAAHLDGSGATSSATEIHRTLAPAMAQFPGSFTFMCSSPWTKVGRFYEAHRNACEIDKATNLGRVMDAFTLQIPSWELYSDWDQADTIPMWPDGPNFAAQTRAVISADTRELQVEHDRDPASYLVEFEGQWATVSDRYLPASMVDKIFEPFDGRVLEELDPKRYQCRYALHIDLSLSGDNSALALGHIENLDGAEHVVYDRLIIWRPSDYADRQVDYDEIAETAVELATVYDAAITIDQYQSMAMIDKINRRLEQRSAGGLRGAQMAPQVVNTTGPSKLERWELTKGCASEGRLHAPFDKQAHDELSFLRRVDHRIEAPTSGPVTTDDLADAMSHVVVALHDPGAGAFARFSQAGLVGTSMFPSNPYSAHFGAARPGNQRELTSRPERGRQYRR